MKKHNDTEFIIEAMVFGAGEAIRRQEKQGQNDVVNFSVLPIECDRENSEALGIIFHDNHDDLFVNVTLPNGWYKKAGNHSMWSGLYDNKDRLRGKIFYKAAHYDRNARMSLSTRYTYSCAPICGYGDNYDADETAYTASVYDSDGNTIWESGTYIRDRGNLDWSEIKKLDTQGKIWLNENKPYWQNVLAYWDDETN